MAEIGSLELFTNGDQGLIGVPTDHGLPIGQGPHAPIFWTAAPTNGQILIGYTGENPVLNTLTAGTGILISNGPGTITISSSGASAETWETISANTSLSVNTGYICIGGGVLSLSLPVGALGNIIDIILDGSMGWSLNVGASSVRIGDEEVSSGGALTSSAQGDTIRLVCQSATRWNIFSSMGNIMIS